MARLFKPIEPDPELDALLKKVKDLPPMTPAQKRLQRISFAYGNLPEESNRTKEDVARIHDETYGVSTKDG
ncbi:MAG: hypothetical protein AAF141_13875 [Pseudomonadota bacterium]